MPNTRANLDGSRTHGTSWGKRFAALAVALFFVIFAVSFSFIPSVSAASPESSTDRGKEQLMGKVLNGATVEVRNSGSVTAIVTAYVKKAGGEMKYHNIDDITLIPGETTEIKVNGLADGVGVVSKRGFIYPIDTTTVIRGRTEPGAPVTVSGSPVIDKTHADEEGYFELVVPAPAVEGDEHEFHIIAGDAVKLGQFGPNDKSQGWMGFKENRVIETVEIGTTENVGEIDLEFDPLEVQYDLSSAVADFSEEIGGPNRKVIEENGKEIHRITRGRNVKFEGWESEGGVKISFERIHNFPEDENVTLDVNDYSDLEDVEIANHPGLRAVEREHKEGSFSISAVPKSLGAVGSLKASIHAGGREVFDLGEEIGGDNLPEEWKEWLEIGLGKDKIRFKAPRVLKNRWSKTNVKTAEGKYKFTKVRFEKYGPGNYDSKKIPIEIRSGGEGEKFEGKVRLSITGADPSLNAELVDEEVYVGEGGEVNTTLRISPDNPEKGGKNKKAITIMAEEVNPDGSEPLSVEMGVVVNLEAASEEVEDEVSDSWYEWFDLSANGHRFEGSWNKSVDGYGTSTSLTDSGTKYLKKRHAKYSYALRDWEGTSLPISIEEHNFDGKVNLGIKVDPGLRASLKDSSLDVHSTVSTDLNVKPTVGGGTNLGRDITVYAWDANPPEGVDALQKDVVADITIVVPDKGPKSKLVGQWKEWFELDAAGKIYAWNEWTEESYSTGWTTTKTEESTQGEEFLFEDYNSQGDARDAAEQWAKKGDMDVTTKIKLTGYIEQLLGDYKAPLEGTPQYIDLPPSDYEPEVDLVEEWGKSVSWVEKESEKYETEDAATNKYLDLVNTNIESFPIQEYKNIKMENETDYNEPIEWGAGWWEKKWHFKDYSDKSKAEKKLKDVKKTYGYYGEDMYPDEYKAKWYTLNSNSKTYDTKKQAKDEKDAYWSWETDPSLIPESMVPRYNEKIVSVPEYKTQYKAEWTATEHHSKTYDDWSDADDKRDSTGGSLTSFWDDTDEWHPGHYETVTHKKWFDHSWDHSGKVVDKKCVDYNTYCADRDYKIKWTTTEHHKTWISGYWTGCYKWARGYDSSAAKNKWVCDDYDYGYYGRYCASGHWKHKYWDSTCHWHSGHWYRWTTTETHKKWFDHSWDHSGKVVDKKCVDYNTYCADRDYKIKWTIEEWHDGYWTGGYDYKVKWTTSKHKSKWFDSYGEAFARNDPTDFYIETRQKKVDTDYRYKWDTRSYGSTETYTKSYADYVATKGDRHKVYVKPIEWQVEYYEKNWRYKDGFKSESAAKDAYSERYKHGGYTYETDWGVDWTVSWDVPHEKKYANSGDAWDKYWALDGKDGIKNLDIESEKVSVGYKAKRYGKIKTQEKTTYTYSWKMPWYRRSSPSARFSADPYGTNGHKFRGDVELSVVDASDSDLAAMLSDEKVSANGRDESVLSFGGKTHSYAGTAYEVGPIGGDQWVKIRGKDASGPLTRTKKVELDIGTLGSDRSSESTRTRYDFEATGAPPFTAELTKREVTYGKEHTFMGLIPVGLELKESPPKIIIRRGDVKKTIWSIGGIEGRNAWADLMPQRTPYTVVIKLKSMQTGRTQTLSFVLNPEGDLAPKVKYH